MSAAAVTPGQKQALSMWEMLSLVSEIGLIVAIPAFLFGFGGATLDVKFGTKPFLTITGLALALTLSIITLIRTVKRVLPL